MNNNTNIEFALRGIQTVEFAIMKELYSDDKEDIEIGMNAEFAINSGNEHEIACMPEVIFLQEKTPFLKLKIACLFAVKPETWDSYLQKDKDSIVFPKGFTDHLLMLSVGTLRGTLHGKTEGTIFNKFFLPTVNVTTFYNDDMEIKL